MRESKLWVWSVALVLAAGLIAGCATSGRADRRPAVLLVPREFSMDTEYMLINEVGVMKRLLEDAGYRVVVASRMGEPFQGTATTVTPDLKLADVRVRAYAGFMFACMAAGTTEPAPESIEFVKKAAATGRPVAAQYSAVYVAGLAGVLKGKRYAYESDIMPGAIYAGTGVVRDGNIITSGTCPYMARMTKRPDGTPELTRLFIEALGGPRKS
jgi:putative intracellular protease/amidase